MLKLRARLRDSQAIGTGNIVVLNQYQTQERQELKEESLGRSMENWEGLVLFHPFLTVGFCLEAEGRTEIAAGLKANYKTVFIGTWPELQYLESGELELSWKLDVSSGAFYDDQLILTIYCPELQITDGFIGGHSRAEGKCRHRLDERIAGKALEVYVSVAALDRKQMSDSTYMGKFSL